MKQNGKRVLSLVLAICLCLAMVPAMGIEAKAANFSCDYVPHPDPVTCMLNVAMAQEGRNGAQMGYTNEWCAWFVSDCAILAGQSTAIPYNGSCTTLKSVLLNNAGGIDVTNNPQPGDICFFDYNKTDGLLDHVEIVYAVSGNQISTIGGNSGNGNHYTTRIVQKHATADTRIDSIIRPAYRSNADAIDLGVSFDAVILNTAAWKPIAVDSDDNVHLQTEAGNANELWRFTRNDSGYYPGSYSIQSMATGAALEIKDGNITPGTPVVATDGYWGGAYQTWYICPSTNGYVLRSAHYPNENLVLDLQDNNSADGTSINIYPRNNSAAQNLTLYREADVQLTAPTLSITAGTSSTPTTFSWNDVCGESGYSVFIWEDESLQTLHHRKQNIQLTQYQITLPAGTYCAYVNSENYFDYKQSNRITFTVAQGELLPSYTISYDANGGTGAPASQTKMFGVRQTLSDQIPVRDGYEFLGWATTKNAASAVYQPGDYYEEDSDITLYAVWKAAGCQHSYETTQVAETCTEAAHTLYTCTKCGYSYRSASPYEPLGHTGGTATCKDKAICRKCGTAYGNTDPSNHAGGTEVKNAKDATCTEAGYTGDTHCAGCGVKTKTGETTKATGHAEEVLPAKAATCTESGLTEGKKCSACGVVTVKQETIKAKAHNYDSNVVDPTYTQKGYTEYTCSVCGDSYKDTYTPKLTLPKKLTITAVTNPASGKPVVSWTELEGDVTYKVYRATSAKGKYSLKDEVTGGSYEDTSASVGKKYYYKVKAVVDGKTTEYSAYKSAACKCAAPVVTAKNTNSSGKVKLSWKKVSGAKKYYVYRVSSSGKSTKIGTTTKTYYTDSSAKVGTTYSYKVKAVASKSSYNSAYSELLKGKRICAQPDLAVKVASSGKPGLSWDKVSGAKEYKIFRADTKDGEYTLIKTTTSTSCTDKTAEFDKDYWYQVDVVGSKTGTDNNTDSPVSVHTTCAKPSVSVKLSKKKPLLSWKPVEGATKYYVYRATSKSGKYKKIATVTDATSYRDAKAKKGKTYYYKVKAIAANSDANSAYSSVDKIKSK